MDFPTRDRYRHVVEKIAKSSRHSESQVARQAIQLAHEGAARKGGGDRTAHVGFYLIDKGLAQLEQTVDMRRSIFEALRSVSCRFPLLLYVGTIMLVTAIITGSFLAKAQALAPEHPEVLAAAGFVAGNSYDPERALGYLDRSLAQNPSNGEVLNWRKGNLESLGRYELVLAAAADAARADPLSKLQVSNYIDELVRFGADSELGPTVERLRKLDEGWGQMALGLIAHGRGDRAGAVRHFLPALQLGCDLANPRLALVLSDLGLTEESLHVPGGDPVALRLARGDVAGAEVRALAGLRRAPGDIDARTDLFFVHYAAGRFGEAAELAGRIYDDLHGTGLEPIILIDMAVAARAASRPAEASRYSEQSRQLIDRFARAGLTPLILDFYRGRRAAYDGQDDRAVALLLRALTATGFSWGRADLDHPVFARLLRRPDYVAALKKLDAILAKQRAQVVEMLCGPKRISETWQPAPETCAGATPSP
jgi:tetratricopeptide (TPR) repeat protein